MAPDQLLEQKQAEKKEVKGYFETTGFDRWNRIYSCLLYTSPSPRD